MEIKLRFNNEGPFGDVDIQLANHNLLYGDPNSGKTFLAGMSMLPSTDAGYMALATSPIESYLMAVNAHGEQVRMRTVFDGDILETASIGGLPIPSQFHPALSRFRMWRPELGADAIIAFEEADELDYWLRHLDLPYRTAHYEKTGTVETTGFITSVQHVGTGQVFRMRRMGYAMSSLMSLLSFVLRASADSIIYLDRPGIGLHSAIHHKLADVFVYYGEAKSIRWLIETESDGYRDAYTELMRTGEIDTEDVQLLYVLAGMSEFRPKSVVSVLEWDKQRSGFDGWPGPEIN